MRSAFILVLVLAGPAAAWDFTAIPVCTLRHATAEAEVTVTYDPRQPQPYALAITRAGAWPAAPIFALRFDGARAMTLTTDRHHRAGGTLTVRDTGFGNVLDGLEFNRTATALAGDEAVAFPLGGAAPAAPEVAKFRDCTRAAVS